MGLKTKLFRFIIFLAWTSHGLAFTPPCNQLKCGEAAKLRLSEKGIEKILSLGFDAVTQHSDLKDEANKAIDKAKFPHKFDMGTTRMGKVSAAVDNAKFEKLKFGKSKVDVDKRDINVCVPVDEMDLKVDASIDVFGSRLEQKGARAFVDPQSPQKPKVCFKGKVDETGQVGPLIHVSNEVPTDIAQETKSAMLDVDLSKANEDEILFTYMTLYMMEENMQLPTKVSFSSVYEALKDPNPETLKKLVDIDKMRETLKEIKGKLPPANKKKDEGIVDYVGNLKVDLNLSANKNSLKSDQSMWNDAYNILQEEDKNNPNGGWFDSLKNLGSRIVRAGKRVVDGAIQNLKVGAEDILRKRFLPYLQESFNKNVTTSSPIMTAVAKTAEKHLVTLAKEKANKAIAEFQRAQGVQAGNFSTQIKEPLWNIQDMVDSQTLRRNEELLRKGSLSALFTDSFHLNDIPNKKAFLKGLDNEMEKVENYLDAIDPKSSDREALNYIENELGPMIEAIKRNVVQASGRHVNPEIREKMIKIYDKLKMKVALLKQKIAERNGLHDMHVSLSFFNSISRGPQISIGFPELCDAGVGKMPESSKISPQEIQSHDISGEVSIDAINAHAMRRAKNGDFDFCLLDNELKSCASGNNFNNRCRFLEPPKLVWNEQKQKHQIDLKKIQCETRMMNAEPKCKMQTKSDIPVLGFIFNTVTSGIGSACKLLGDQADNFVTASVGQNLIDLKVDVEPKVCGNSVCLSTNLDDSNVRADLERLNPNLASIVGKVTSLVLSPFTDYVKKEIVDQKIMNFMSKKVGQPLEVPTQIQLKKVSSEKGKFVVLADIDDGEKTQRWVNECINRPNNCEYPYQNGLH
ncbi:MAG: hypothetical protein OHK0056_07360 [Bacteriovoracaceae bacterium]